MVHGFGDINLQGGEWVFFNGGRASVENLARCKLFVSGFPFFEKVVLVIDAANGLLDCFVAPGLQGRNGEFGRIDFHQVLKPAISKQMRLQATADDASDKLPDRVALPALDVESFAFELYRRFGRISVL